MSSGEVSGAHRDAESRLAEKPTSRKAGRFVSPFPILKSRVLLMVVWHRLLSPTS